MASLGFPARLGTRLGAVLWMLLWATAAVAAQAGPDGPAVSTPAGKPAAAKASGRSPVYRAKVPEGFVDGRADLSASVSSQPSRLVRGRAGELCVTATLRAPNVVLPDSHATVEFDSTDLPLILGRAQVDAAVAAATRGAFEGRLVHEHAVVFRIPVTVTGDAKRARYPVRGSLALGLHDGGTGKFRGKFRIAFAGDVRVRAAARTTGNARKSIRGQPDPGELPTGREGQRQPLPGAVAAAEPEVARGADGQDESLSAPGIDGIWWWILAVPAVLLLIVVRRR